MQYAYLIGAGILGLFWLLIFVRRKDLRKELTFGGLLGIPFGMTEFFYIPEYWNPPSVFNLIDKIGFGIESVLFGFFVGGIAASLFEFLEKKRLVSIHKHQNNEDHYVPYLLLIIFYLSLELTLPLYTIYNLSFSMLLAAFLIAFKRRDLIPHILISGSLFAVVYFVLFLVFNFLFPTFIHEIYSLENLTGIIILGVPIEEILFAFSVGACWSTFFKFIRGYRTRNFRKSNK